MNLALVEQLKRITIISLVSDDTLMEALVLKGGNAMQIHDVGYRASFDLDYSLEDEFDKDIENIKVRMKKSIENTFREHGYVAFDFKFLNRPETLKEELKSFWGGYKSTFKIINFNAHEKHKNDINYLRRNAVELTPTKSTSFKIDISKHEYTAPKTSIDVDGYTVYVYPPQLIVFEKIRAICQQNDEYTEVIHTRTQRGRAKDFYDIHVLLEGFPIDITSEESKEIIKSVFAIKKVPLHYLKLIRQNLEKHRQDFASLKDTVKQSENLESFNFYSNYVIGHFENLFP